MSKFYLTDTNILGVSDTQTLTSASTKQEQSLHKMTYDLLCHFQGETNVQSERDLIGESHFFYKGMVKIFKSGCISILVLMDPAHPAMIYLVSAGLQRALDMGLQKDAGSSIHSS